MLQMDGIIQLPTPARAHLHTFQSTHQQFPSTTLAGATHLHQFHQSSHRATKRAADILLLYAARILYRPEKPTHPLFCSHQESELLIPSTFPHHIQHEAAQHESNSSSDYSELPRLSEPYSRRY